MELYTSEEAHFSSLHSSRDFLAPPRMLALDPHTADNTSKLYVRLPCNSATPFSFSKNRSTCLKLINCHWVQWDNITGYYHIFFILIYLFSILRDLQMFNSSRMFYGWPQVCSRHAFIWTKLLDTFTKKIEWDIYITKTGTSVVRIMVLSPRFLFLRQEIVVVVGIFCSTNSGVLIPMNCWDNLKKFSVNLAID